MITQEQIDEMRKMMSELNGSIREAERELKRQTARPYQMAERVTARPHSMPGNTCGGVVSRERVLVSRRDLVGSDWTLFLALAKRVVATRAYLPRYDRYWGHRLESSDLFTNRMDELTPEQLDAVAEFMEDAIELYNRHFAKNHPFALVQFPGDTVPSYVPVVIE